MSQGLAHEATAPGTHTAARTPSVPSTRVGARASALRSAVLLGAAMLLTGAGMGLLYVLVRTLAS